MEEQTMKSQDKNKQNSGETHSNVCHKNNDTHKKNKTRQNIKQKCTVFCHIVVEDETWISIHKQNKNPKPKKFKHYP